MKAFLCHSNENIKFMIKVARNLSRILDIVFCLESDQRSDKNSIRKINDELRNCTIIIVFVGKSLSECQVREVESALEHERSSAKKHFFIILFPQVKEIPTELGLLNTRACFPIKDTSDRESVNVSKKILLHLNLPWVAIDDLPFPHLFSNEKDIINFFINLNAFNKKNYSNLPREFRDKLIKGCPTSWPEINKIEEKINIKNKNLIKQESIGEWLPENTRIVAAALAKYHLSGDDIHNDCLLKQKFYFSEAGIREFLKFPRKNNQLNVAVLVSGGMATGINAVIDGITERHEMYASKHRYRLNVYGLKNGFYAFERLEQSFILLNSQSPASNPKRINTSQFVSEGGSMLGTSRVENLFNLDTRLEMLNHIVSQLFKWHIDILYVIGGDGSMKAAHAIWNYAKEYNREINPDRVLSVVAIPKTMDNDILWVWQTIGFMSAVERAKNVIESLAIEVKANPRLSVIQLLGSDSGSFVSHAVLASTTDICDAALIPEISFSLKNLAIYMKRKIFFRAKRSQTANRIPHGLIVLAETSVPTDAMNFVDDSEIGLSQKEKDAIIEYEALRKSQGRIEGHTNDNLRNACLKIVSRGLLTLLPALQIDSSQTSIDWGKLRIFTNEPRNLLRYIPPSTIDIILGKRLGTLAVDNALAGYTDFMISQWLTEFVLVPLKLVILGRKRIPLNGIFWKSVLSKTGQPAQL